jgi:hypothetical protein
MTGWFMHKNHPLLSLILCSRNDQYMGNSRWRLQTTLNYIAQKVYELNREEDVEILVADWGSKPPLQEVLELSPEAIRIVSFLLIPHEIARSLQKDSPFPEVLALNAAARRVNGEYIGRIDQDTLVGKRFFEIFFDFIQGKRQLDIPFQQALLYSNRREVPYRFSSRCPPARYVDWFIQLFDRSLPILRLRDRPFWTYWVGIWLIHRTLWYECGGYDERFLYYNWMEVEMILRLSQKYAIIDLGTIVDHSFYHLDHANPRIVQPRHVKKNPDLDLSTPPENFIPNSPEWGLANYPLEVRQAVRTRQESTKVGPHWYDYIAFATLVTTTAVQILGDKVYRFAVDNGRFWLTRARRARRALIGQPFQTWPGMLINMWVTRRTRK